MATDAFDLEGIDLRGMSRSEILSTLLDASLLDLDADFSAPTPPSDGRGRLAASFAGPADEARDERGRWTSHGFSAAQIAGMSHAQRRALAGIVLGLPTKGMGEEELRRKLTPKGRADSSPPASSGLPAPERKAALEELMAAYLRGEREGGLDPRGDLKHLPGGDRLAAAETAVNRIVAEQARKTSVGVPVESLYQQLQQSGIHLTPAEFRAVLLSIHQGGRQRLGGWSASPFQIPRPDLSPVVSGKIMAWVHQGSGAGFSEDAEFFDSDQPRDERGRWAAAAAAMVAANPHPKGQPPFPVGGGRRDLIAKDPQLAAAVKARDAHIGASHRAYIADAVRRILTEPDDKPVPVPPADAPQGRKVAAAKKAIERVADLEHDLTRLGPAFASRRAEVAASHPDAPAAVEAARAELTRRHAAAMAVMEAHIAALPDDLRAKARKAAEAAFSRPDANGAVWEVVGEDDGRGRLAEFYSPDQPRDDRGRWTEGAGSGAARLHYAEAVRQFARGTGPATSAEVAAVAGHLSRLTVAQLHGLRREHGLKASSPDKAGLVRKLAGRFAAHRAGKMFGSLPGGRRVEFVPHPSQNKTETTVLVDPKKLEADWRKDSGHLPAGGVGKSEIKGRREAFGRFLSAGQPVQASRVAIGPAGHPVFNDGRHRFAVLRDAGATHAAVTVPKTQAEEFKRRYGVESAAGPHPSGATVEPATAYDRKGWYSVRSAGGTVIEQFPTRQEAERFRDALPAHKPADAAERAARERDAAQRRLAAAEAAAREHPHGEGVLDELRAARGAAGASVPQPAAARVTSGKPIKVGDYLPTGAKVHFHSGEHAGHTVTLNSQIQKRYGKSDTTYRGQIDGIKGGAGEVIVTDRHLAEHATRVDGAPASTPQPSASRVTPPPPPLDARGRLSAGPVNPLRDKPPASESRHSADAVQKMSVAELRDAAAAKQGGRLSVGTDAHLRGLAETERRLRTGKDSRGAAISEGEKERLRRSLIEGKAKVGRLLRGERATFSAADADGRGRFAG